MEDAACCRVGLAQHRSYNGRHDRASHCRSVNPLEYTRARQCISPDISCLIAQSYHFQKARGHQLSQGSAVFLSLSIVLSFLVFLVFLQISAFPHGDNIETYFQLRRRLKLLFLFPQLSPFFLNFLFFLNISYKCIVDLTLNAMH